MDVPVPSLELVRVRNIESPQDNVLLLHSGLIRPVLIIELSHRSFQIQQCSFLKNILYLSWLEHENRNVVSLTSYFIDVLSIHIIEWTKLDWDWLRRDLRRKYPVHRQKSRRNSGNPQLRKSSHVVDRISDEQIHWARPLARVLLPFLELTSNDWPDYWF